MAFTLDAITYTNPITGGTTDWLCANVGDSITINQTISISEYAISSTDNIAILNNKDGWVEDGVCTGLDFSKFKVGDTVKINNYITGYQYGTTYTILRKPDDNTIILSTSIAELSINNTTSTTVFSIVTPITALTYKWNFIENNEALNFFSKVDGSVQMATITGLNAAGAGTNKPMTFIGALPYQIGSIVVDEISLATTPIYKSTFKIKHTTKITPIMLAEQWDDILNGIAPDYYFNLNCLKSVFEYEARYLLNDPNDVQTLQIEDIQGNSGWFNENFNTKLTKYYVENLAYTKTSDSSSINSIELTTSDTTGFSFSIRNTTSTPFVENSTKVILNFCKAPNSSDEYSANGRNMQDNFVWETVTLTANTVDTLVNGDNYGTGKLQSLKSCNCNFDSTSSLTISGLFQFLTDGFNVFNESNEPRYLFFVSVCNHSLTASVSDRVSLLVDASAFYFKTVYADLIMSYNNIMPRMQTAYTLAAYKDSLIAPYRYLSQFEEDLNVAYSEFVVETDYLGGGNTFSVIKMGVKIECVPFTGEADKFTLEQYYVNTPNNQYVGDYPFFDISLSSGYSKQVNIGNGLRSPNPTQDNIIAKFDILDDKTYKFAYPFVNRWESWESLNGVNSQYFNPALPNNGYNHLWSLSHYEATIRVTNEITVKYNGVPATYSNFKEYHILPPNLGLAGLGRDISCVIKTYDPDTLTELTDGINHYILGYKETLVEATFTVTDNFNNEAIVFIGVEFEEGGRYGKFLADEFSLSEPLLGTSVIYKAKIDFTKLNLNKINYKLSARLFEPKDRY